MKYCELLVFDAIYSKPYFQNDREIVSYLKSKLCVQTIDDNDSTNDEQAILSEETFVYWLQHKKSPSRDAKTREKLLTKKYRALMQACIANWAKLFFHPDVATSLDASRHKRFWLRNKETYLAKFWEGTEKFTETSVIFGIANIPRQVFYICLFIYLVYLYLSIYNPFLFSLLICRDSEFFQNLDFTTVLKDFVDEFKCNVEKLFKELTKLIRQHAKGERVHSYTIRSFGMVDDSCPMFHLEDMMYLILNLEGKIRRYDPQAEQYNEYKSNLLRTLTTHEVINFPLFVISCVKL